MTQEVRVLASKPDNLCMIPEAHTVGSEPTLTSSVTPTQVPWLSVPNTHTDRYRHFLSQVVLKVQYKTFQNSDYLKIEKLASREVRDICVLQSVYSSSEFFTCSSELSSTNRLNRLLLSCQCLVSEVVPRLAIFFFCLFFFDFDVAFGKNNSAGAQDLVALNRCS